jgi:hypothetical protein
MFEYDSAKTVNIVADMTKLLAYLEDNEVNVIGVVIDNAQNLRRAFDMASDLEAVKMIGRCHYCATRAACRRRTSCWSICGESCASERRWSGSGC